jgi:LacI family transcriptional regulator
VRTIEPMTEKWGSRVTLREVAAHIGVDASLVSKVLNEYKNLNIPDSTRQRVLAAAAELNYRPNIAARGLKLSRTFFIGVVIPDLTNPAYASMIQGAQREASAAGYDIFLGANSTVASNDMVEESFARMLMSGRVDGVLIASGTVPDSAIKSLVQRDSPIVVVNRRVRGINASASLDDAAGAGLATNHLLDLGHRRIAMVGGPQSVETTHRRVEGFRSAQEPVGDSEAIVSLADGWDARSGYNAARELLRAHPETTAIFAGSLLSGIGVLRAAHDSGRSVPEDLSVVALHDAAIAEFTLPPLTTVAMPMEELGSAAMRLVLSFIDGESPSDLVIETPPYLVLRDSTGPCQTSSSSMS